MLQISSHQEMVHTTLFSPQRKTSGRNLEPNSAGLKSPQAGEVWQKYLEEHRAAQSKERSLLGHIVCSEETQRKILESDIFRILEFEGVTEVGALYKVSPSKLVLLFGSKTAKRNSKIQRSNAILAIVKFVSISANELILSEMWENLSL